MRDFEKLEIGLKEISENLDVLQKERNAKIRQIYLDAKQGATIELEKAEQKSRFRNVLCRPASVTWFILLAATIYMIIQLGLCFARHGDDVLVDEQLGFLAFSTIMSFVITLGFSYMTMLAFQDNARSLKQRLSDLCSKEADVFWREIYECDKEVARDAHPDLYMLEERISQCSGIVSELRFLLNPDNDILRVIHDECCVKSLEYRVLSDKRGIVKKKTMEYTCTRFSTMVDACVFSWIEDTPVYLVPYTGERWL